MNKTFLKTIDMNSDFTYDQIPFTFVYCLYSQCPKAADCLRHKLLALVPQERTVIGTINPVHIAAHQDKCLHFMPDRTVRFAMGITHLLDKLPHSEAVIVKNLLYGLFQRNMYYRIKNKERSIKPSEQESIRQIFLSRGITDEPVFDEYIEQYNWDD